MALVPVSGNARPSPVHEVRNGVLAGPFQQPALFWWPQHGLCDPEPQAVNPGISENWGRGQSRENGGIVHKLPTKLTPSNGKVPNTLW